MEADDVIHSLNHHRGEKSKSAAKVIVESIEEIKKDDKYTISFVLKSPNADFPYLMSDYHLVIGPKDSDFTDGIYSGAYVLQKFEPGVRAFVTRNPNYFKSDRAHFDEVESLVINDVNARTNALKTGQIDLMSRCELKTVHLLKKTKGLQVIRQDGFKHYTFAMRCNTAPYDNNDIRLALKYGVDREQMLKTIQRGYGSIGNDHPISTANRYHASEIPQRQYDPDKAKFHLKKAGLGDTTFKFHTAEAAFIGATDAGVMYRESAAKAGINIEVVREPNDGYWSNVWMKKPWCAVFWGGRPTEDMMFSTAYASGAAWNDTAWEHKRFNELLVGARGELDEPKRRSMYVEMQRIVHDETVEQDAAIAKLYAAGVRRPHDFGGRIGCDDAVVDGSSAPHADAAGALTRYVYNAFVIGDRGVLQHTAQQVIGTAHEDAAPRVCFVGIDQA